MKSWKEAAGRAIRVQSGVWGGACIRVISLTPAETLTPSSVTQALKPHEAMKLKIPVRILHTSLKNHKQITPAFFYEN